ncbi:MAG: HAD family hydrolase [Deltaproteobacteria bacterium]|nr:HAD family hydrolase [Deltaproteobacteria bacterium]
MHKGRLMLLDFDGVVVDSLEFYEKLVRTCLRRIGHPIIETREDFLDLFDNNFYESLKRRGVDVAAFNEAAGEIAAESDYGSIKPVEGFAPIMGRLRRKGWSLTVLSSNSRFAIEKILSLQGLRHCFDDILGADEGLAKTDKIFAAMKARSANPDETVYVGDTVGDILEARDAGIAVVAVAWGWHDRKRLAMACPAAIIDRPEDLLDVIAGNDRKSQNPKGVANGLESRCYGKS